MRTVANDTPAPKKVKSSTPPPNLLDLLQGQGPPLSLANPNYSGPVQQVGADMTQFPQYQNYSFNSSGVGTPPTSPYTDPVGAYTYGSANPQALLSQINSLYSGKPPDFSGEASNQASTIFKPVLDDLTNQSGLAQKNAKYNDSQLAAMYSALQNSIGADAKNITAGTGKNVAAIQNNGKQAVAAIGNDYGNASQQSADTMAKLGIQAAAPAVLPKAQDAQALLQGYSQLNTQGAVNLANQLGTNAQNFNTSQRNIAGFEGTENRHQNQMDLSNKLAGLASQRAQIGSQQAQEASGYMQNLQNQYLNSVNQKANALTQMYGQQQQMQLAQMQFAQQQQQNQMQMMQFQKSLMPSAYQQWEMTPSSDKLASYAGQLFGADGNTASSALNFVESMGNHQAPTALAFADSVLQGARSSNDPNIKGIPENQLRALALQAYQQLNVNPNIMNYLMSANGQG